MEKAWEMLKLNRNRSSSKIWKSVVSHFLFSSQSHNEIESLSHTLSSVSMGPLFRPKISVLPWGLGQDAAAEALCGICWQPVCLLSSGVRGYSYMTHRSRRSTLTALSVCGLLQSWCYSHFTEIVAYFLKGSLPRSRSAVLFAMEHLDTKVNCRSLQNTWLYRLCDCTAFKVWHKLDNLTNCVQSLLYRKYNMFFPPASESIENKIVCE